MKINTRRSILAGLLGGLLFASAQTAVAASRVAAQPAPGGMSEAELESRIADLKKRVINLNSELTLLEQDLMFPVDTRVAVYLSIDLGEFFKLETVELKIDGREQVHHMYSRRELDALLRGGTQRLYLGNLVSGEHELVALFTGIGPQGRNYKRGTTLKFTKDKGARHIELKIVDNESSLRPDFAIREW